MTKLILDMAREAKIYLLRHAINVAPNQPARIWFVSRMAANILRRSPEQVSRMERRMGIL